MPMPEVGRSVVEGIAIIMGFAKLLEAAELENL